MEDSLHPMPALCLFSDVALSVMLPLNLTSSKALLASSWPGRRPCTKWYHLNACYCWWASKRGWLTPSLCLAYAFPILYVQIQDMGLGSVCLFTNSRSPRVFLFLSLYPSNRISDIPHHYHPPLADITPFHIPWFTLTSQTKEVEEESYEPPHGWRQWHRPIDTQLTLSP